MSKKFEYKEFSADNAAKTLKKQYEQDEEISKAIISHLSNSFNSSSVNEDDVRNYNDNSQVQNLESNNIQNHSKNSGIYSEEDIEDIKSQSFEEGYKKAKQDLSSEFEQKLNDKNKEIKLIESIADKITNLDTPEEPVSDYVDLVADVVTEISHKLMLNFPTDLAFVLKRQLTYLIGNSYQGGEVLIKVNKKSKEKLDQLIKSEELVDKLDKVKLTIDSTLQESDCVVEYNGAKLVYDKSLIKKEIEEVVKQFTQD